MLTNLAIIVMITMVIGLIFERLLKLPSILGMILTGIILGPYVLDFISPMVLNLSNEFKTIALTIIIIRAGLGIPRDSLKIVGLKALKMGIVPFMFEAVLIFLFARYYININYLSATVLAIILSAVSPAVIVPCMLELKNKTVSPDKDIPTMILASASLDNIVAITFFGIAIGLHTKDDLSIAFHLIKIPFSVINAFLIGGMAGYILVWIFKKIRNIRDTNKTFLLLMIAVLFYELEKHIPMAGLLGVMVTCFIILATYEDLGQRLAIKFNKMWVIAEITLFVFIGAQVNINMAFDSGWIGLSIIFIGLLGRIIGVYVSLSGTNLVLKEITFCAIAFTPKATVQAALASIPLALGLKHGELILAVAVLSIIITSPLGLIGIKKLGPICGVVDKDRS